MAPPLPLVCFSYVPAPVGVRRTGAPARTDGPRDHSGTGVASRPTEPSKPASSSAEHTFTDASTKSASNFSKAACLAGHLGVAQFLPPGRQFFCPAHPVLGLGGGVDQGQHQAEQVTGLAVTGQEGFAALGVPVYAELVPPGAGILQNNNLVAAFMCSGRSSMASNSSATRRARTFICRGRPVFFAGGPYFVATPELSITAAQKEMASSEGKEPKAGTGRAWAHSRAEPSSQLGLGARCPRDVAGVTQQ